MEKTLADIFKKVRARLADLRVRRLSTLPPLILLFGHKASQETKCFSVLQGLMSSPISAINRGGFIDAVNLCKVNAADAKRLLPKIEFRAIAWLLSSYSRGLQFALIGFRFETLQMFGDLSVTDLDLLL